MTKKPRAFRPTVSDVLEARTVPSSFDGFGFGGSVGGGFGTRDHRSGGPDGNGGFGGNSGLQTAVSADAPAIQAAFRTFQQSYQNDVQNILFALGTISDNRAAFDAQVAADLETLNSSIDSAISNLTGGTSNPTLVADIEADLLGSDGSSLKSELTSLSTPTTTGSWSERIFDWEASAEIAQASRTINQLVNSATVPTGTVTKATIQTLKDSVNTAYQSFTQGYLNATETTATNPATNRAAFDTAVQGLVTTLATNVQTAVTNANLSTSVADALASTINADLTGTPTKGTSLQVSLAALGSPSSTTGFAGWYFQTRSRGVIQGSERTVITDILSAINAYNLSLTA